MTTTVCRGSVVLGSGCRQCRKCFNELYEIMYDLTDSGECRLDHHGYCQEHLWFSTEKCPHALSRMVIEKVEEENA